MGSRSLAVTGSVPGSRHRGWNAERAVRVGGNPESVRVQVAGCRRQDPEPPAPPLVRERIGRVSRMVASPGDQLQSFAESRS